MISTDEGIQIDASDIYSRKADLSINLRVEPDSNAIAAKQFKGEVASRIMTDRGIQTVRGPKAPPTISTRWTQKGDPSKHRKARGKTMVPE
jgi:hypothetical protein